MDTKVEEGRKNIISLSVKKVKTKTFYWKESLTNIVLSSIKSYKLLKYIIKLCGKKRNIYKFKTNGIKHLKLLIWFLQEIVFHNGLNV